MTVPPGRPRAVLFDWDDTLIDNWRTITHALNVTFAAHGMPQITVAEAKRRATRSMRDSFPAMFGPDWTRARDLFLATFAERHLAELEVKPGAVALLDLLRDAAIPIAVISNKNGPFLRAEADHLAWTERFCALVGAGDAVADKPDPAAVALALAGARIAGDVADERIWLVGDSAVDMACAAATGCTGIRIDWTGRQEEVTEGQKCCVGSLGEMRALVSTCCDSI